MKVVFQTELLQPFKETPKRWREESFWRWFFVVTFLNSLFETNRSNWKTHTSALSNQLGGCYSRMKEHLKWEKKWHFSDLRQHTLEKRRHWMSCVLRINLPFKNAENRWISWLGLYLGITSFSAHMQIKRQLKVELSVQFHMAGKHLSHENRIKNTVFVWNRWSATAYWTYIMLVGKTCRYIY